MCTVFRYFLLLLLSSALTYGQTNRNYVFPLDITPALTGTFGEFRADHLHSGVDYTTAGKTGLNVYAIDDGYVARIKVSAGGYGNALYIAHPGGITSVYAHLDQFNVLLADYIEKKQYENELFEIDLTPLPGLFPVRKGDIIGYSGNSGTSTGPHLHFEIRNTATERIINPLFFYPPTNDIQPPEFNHFFVIPVTDKTWINGKNLPEKFTAKKSSAGQFYADPSDTVEVSGIFSIAVLCYDRASGNTTSGVWSCRLSLDGALINEWKMDSFAFDETRYLNALIDYPRYAETGKRLASSRILPGNRLPVYETASTDGVFSFNDNKLHLIEVSATDFSGNTSVLKIFAKRAGQPAGTDNTIKRSGKVFYYGIAGDFDTTGLRLHFQSKSLYDSLIFEYGRLPRNSKTFSEVHNLHISSVPVHQPMKLQISTAFWPPSLSSEKAVIARVESGKFISCGGTWEGSYLSTEILRFGSYCITADTTRPVIDPGSFRNGRKITDQTTIEIGISDDLSGISSYRTEMDGKWILAVYDLKRSKLLIRPGSRAPRGNHVVKIIVVDKCNNTSVKEIQFMIN